MYQTTHHISPATMLEDHDKEIEWTQHDGIVLSEHDKVQLCSGKWLSDKHVNFAQSLLKKQFPQVNGLKSTLLLHKTQDKIVTVIA